MARWTASAEWAAGPALDGQCAMPLGLSLSEGLGLTALALPNDAQVALPTDTCFSPEHGAGL